MQGWAGQTYGEMNVEGLEQMHEERLGDTISRLDDLTITKRFGGTARLMSTHRQGSTDSGSSLNRAPSSTLGRSSSSVSKPPLRTYGAPAAEIAPPPYSGGGVSAVAGKRPPPPPPASRPRAGAPAVVYVTALYDYAATAEGDLSFSAGDKIELVKVRFCPLPGGERGC